MEIIMKKMKKLAAVLMALLMVATLFAACGGSGSSGSGEAAPYEGKYIAHSVSMMGMNMSAEGVADGWALEIAGGGKGTMEVEGTSAKLTYTVEGDTMTIEVEGEEMTATIGEDTLVIDDMMGMGMGITFAKEGSAAAAAAVEDEFSLDDLDLGDDASAEEAEE